MIKLFVFIRMIGNIYIRFLASDNWWLCPRSLSEAIKIINENFPKDSTEFRIEDYGFDFGIRKYKGEAPERRDISYEELIEIDEHFYSDSDSDFDSDSDSNSNCESETDDFIERFSQFYL